MKKQLYVIFIIVLTTQAIFGQDITGHWNGMLKVQGNQLRLAFDITKTTGGYSSTMDSPDQGANGIPVTSTTFNNPLLNFKVLNLGIDYSGKLKGDIVEGIFKQGTQSFPLNLTRELIEKEKPIRPQEPLKPFPYYSEEVTFINPKASIKLAGTLTLPKKEGIYPAVILITGSGPQNRDEELLGHKPFLVISDYLTKNGIAVLRFDDRGTALSEGDFKTATSVDFASDVEAAITFLANREEIDKTKIGLIGHSEGGIIAPMVAANNKGVSFIVLLAGTGISGSELLLLQQGLIGKASGISDSELRKAKEINKGAFNIVINSSNTENLKVELTNFIKKKTEEFPNVNKPSGMSNDDFIDAQVAQLTSPWIQYFLKYDPKTALEKVSCPVFAVNGEKDLQVPPKENLQAIQAALIKGGNKNVTIKEFPNLNHLFQECKTGLPAEYAQIQQTFSPKVLEAVTKWILLQVK